MVNTLVMGPAAVLIIDASHMAILCMQVQLLMHDPIC